MGIRNRALPQKDGSFLYRDIKIKLNDRGLFACEAHGSSLTASTLREMMASIDSHLHRQAKLRKEAISLPVIVVGMDCLFAPNDRVYVSSLATVTGINIGTGKLTFSGAPKNLRYAEVDVLPDTPEARELAKEYVELCAKSRALNTKIKSLDIDEWRHGYSTNGTNPASVAKDLANLKKRYEKSKVELEKGASVRQSKVKGKQ